MVVAAASKQKKFCLAACCIVQSLDLCAFIVLNVKSCSAVVSAVFISHHLRISVRVSITGEYRKDKLC